MGDGETMVGEQVQSPSPALLEGWRCLMLRSCEHLLLTPEQGFRWESAGTWGSWWNLRHTQELPCDFPAPSQTSLLSM